MTFTILNEYHMFKQAKKLITFKYRNRTYLLYLVKDYDIDSYNVMVSYLCKNEMNYNYLDDIGNKKELEYIKKKFSYILGGEKNE